MANSQLPNVPDGFDDLSKAEQIEYVQRLWDCIASDDDGVPVPDRHREVLDARLNSDSERATVDWESVKKKLLDDRES